VYETLDLCGLFDYTVGGTIHLVVNNQVRLAPPTWSRGGGSSKRDIFPGILNRCY
jgi:hypothetical protein